MKKLLCVLFIVCLYVVIGYAGVSDYKSELQAICDRREVPAANSLHRKVPGKSWTESFSRTGLNPDYQTLARKRLSERQLQEVISLLKSCKSFREASCTWSNFCDDYGVEDDSRKNICSQLRKVTFVESPKPKSYFRLKIFIGATLCIGVVCCPHLLSKKQRS